MKNYSSIALILFVSILFGAVHFSQFGEVADLRGLDLFQQPRRSHPEIVILAVDNKSLSEVGRWPWSRSVHANVIHKLKAVEPQIVGIDVLFAEAESPEADAALVNSLADARFKVVLPAELVFMRGTDAPTRAVLPLKELRETPSVLVGHAAPPRSMDEIIRFFPESVKVDEQTYQPFSFVIAQELQAELPADQDLLIKYAGNAGAFQTYSIGDFLADKIEKEKLQQKIILIGATATSLHDTVLVPGAKAPIAGVEWNATVVDNLLLGNGVEMLPRWVAWSLGLGLSGMFLVVSARLRQRIVSVGLLSAAVLFPVMSFILWQFGYGLVFVANLALSLSLFVMHSVYRWYQAEVEKRKIRERFQFYFSPSVLKRILNDPASLQLGGQRREVSILFSDIRNFTTIAESLEPERLTQLLHEYFTHMGEEIMKTDGVLDKFIGDAVMAFWGAPVEQSDHADRAVTAAIGMVKCLEKLQEKWLAEGYPLIKTGIGVSSGEVTVGNMGSFKRFDYTVIGDSVNAAARLEGLTKEYKCPVIISESTKIKLGQDFTVNQLGDVLVKGKTLPLQIYSVDIE